MNFDPQRAQQLFHAVLELTDSVARRQLLDRECAGDTALRQRVEALVRAHDATGGFAGQPSGPALPATVDSPSIARPGMVVAGRYKLLEAIGEGGMGTVWVAEQTEPVRRKVALKLIKAGLDSQSVLARFEAERQALAMMDHPNIAKVLDGGLTDAGRPFFVMEYVKGVPITEYCDATRMSIPERLTLFVYVCQAVQHAHQKGIIHRDLKPSNILVAPYDDKPVPKVIDFGLAKAMHQSLTERTLHTAHDMVLGTPLYMSPEQAQLNNLDVDTRSDIYSLGVVLYELLTGTTPLEKQRFQEAAWDEVRRIIREEEPPPPSTRLSSNATLASLAAGRQTDPIRLTNLVRGELDWIALKALEKDRGRRYESATALARDVERFLADEVVEARPPSMNYRVQKFVRRHKGHVVATSLILLALIGGAIGATYGVIEAGKQQETQLLRKQAEKERDAAQIARTEAETAREAEKAAKVAAELARDDLAKEREKLARVEYGRTIQVAYEQWRDNKIAAARELLQGTREDLRGWEWHFIHRLCHADLLTLKGHTAAVTLATWSADGGHVIAASKDGSVRTWDATSGELVATRLPKEAPVHRVTLSADGSRALFCNDHVGAFDAFLTSLNGGTASLPIKGHTQRAFAVVFSKDGSRMLTGSEDKSARVWDPITGDLLFTFNGHQKPIVSASLSADGSRAATTSDASDSETIVWDTKTGMEVLKLKGQSIVMIAQLRADGHQVLTGHFDSELSTKVWDVQTGAEVLSLKGHTNSITAAAWSPDFKRIATASHDHTVKTWDAQTGNEVFTLKGHTDSVWQVVWNAEGTRLVTASEDMTARVWDAAAKTSTVMMQSSSNPATSAAFSHNGTRLVIGSFDNTSLVTDAANGAELLKLQAPFEHNPKRPEQFYIRSVAFNEDDSRIVTGGWDQTARVWDAVTGKEVLKLAEHTGPVNVAEFNPAATRIVTGSHDKTAKVWDARTGEVVFNFEHADIVDSADWSHDGKSIVTGSHDRTAKIWDGATGDLIQTLTGHTSGVESVAFSQDNTRVLTASSDGTAKVWDAATGKELLTLKGHTGSLFAASYSSDGKRVVTGSRDGTAKVWDAETGADLLTLKEDIGWIESASFRAKDTRVFLRGRSRLKILDASPVNMAFLQRQ